MPAKLRIAGLSFKSAIRKVKTKVATINVCNLASQFGTHFPTAVAIRAINPIVQAIVETIKTVLLITFVEAGKQHFADVGFSVAVSVFRIDNFRRGADEHAFAPRHDSIWKIQAVEENS